MPAQVAIVGSTTTNGGIITATPQTKVKIGSAFVAVSGSTERRFTSLSKVEHSRPKIMIGNAGILQVGDECLSGSQIAQGSPKVLSYAP